MLDKFCSFLAYPAITSDSTYLLLKFIFTTNHLPPSGEMSQQNPYPDNLAYVPDLHQTPQCTVHVNAHHKIGPDCLSKFLFATPKPNIPIKFTKEDASITESHTCFCQTFLHTGEFHLPFMAFSFPPFILDLSCSLSSLLISQLVPKQSIQKAAAKIIPFMLLRPCQTFIFKSNPSSSVLSSEVFS